MNFCGKSIYFNRRHNLVNGQKLLNSVLYFYDLAREYKKHVAACARVLYTVGLPRQGSGHVNYKKNESPVLKFSRL